MANAFIGLPLATLTALQSTYIAQLTASAANESWARDGMQIKRVDIDKVQILLANVNAAISLANGQTSTATYVAFNRI
jgi:hypothetical protein